MHILAILLQLPAAILFISHVGKITLYMYYKPNVCQTHNIKRLTIMILFKFYFKYIIVTHAEYSFPKKPYVGDGGHNIIIHYL